MNLGVIFLFSINLFLSRYAEEDGLVSTLLNGSLSLSQNEKLHRTIS